MPANTNDSPDYETTRARRHPDCWVCAPLRDHSLAVRFEAGADGVVTGEFPCPEEFTGYPGFLHGGVTSALLDGAMTNCLMARGTPGLTARLEVRFLHPVLIGRPVTVRGWLEKSRGSLRMLAADLSQEGRVLATATGRFMDYPA
jgi:acyl-coenzyme A thioesterase PaaI-like protein